MVARRFAGQQLANHRLFVIFQAGCVGWQDVVYPAKPACLETLTELTLLQPDQVSARLHPVMKSPVLQNWASIAQLIFLPISSINLSRVSSRGMRSITGAKKPSTIRRRASFSGTPRLAR